MNPGATSSPPASNRLVSVDVYRGFAMLLMMGEVLRLSAVARALPDSGFWSVLAFHQSHRNKGTGQSSLFSNPPGSGRS